MDLIRLAGYFADEGKAIEFMESVRWPDGPVCPKCGHRKAYHLKPRAGTRRTRKLWKCAKCRKQFTVMVGTVFEDSHIPLNMWLAAFYAMASSKKGISAKQIERSLGITYRSAWFMCHRIREAMGKEPLKGKLGGIVEADETYIGGKGKIPGRGAEKKVPVMTLIERGGRARSFLLPHLGGGAIKGIIRNNVEGTAHIMTDGYPSYKGLDKEFESHSVIDHDEAYVRGIIHINFAESYFSLLKRGIVGAFHHVSEKHLPRYLQEFDFRWNHRKMEDGERMRAAVRGAEGRRLMYKAPRRGL